MIAERRGVFTAVCAVVCPYRAQPTVVCCRFRSKDNERSAGAFHFQHDHHNPHCPGSKPSCLSQVQILAATYHGQREGPAHRRLKQLLFDSLCADSCLSDALVEKTWRDACQPDRWRRPDVSARFLGRPVVFEIQCRRP